MKKWIVKDEAGKLHVVGAEGFIPKGAIAEAPEDADFGDGDALTQVNGAYRLDDAKKAAKKKAHDDAKAKEEADLEAKRLEREARLVIRDRMLAVNLNSMSTAQMRDLLADMRTLISKWI